MQSLCSTPNRAGLSAVWGSKIRDAALPDGWVSRVASGAGMMRLDFGEVLFLRIRNKRSHSN